MNRLRRRKRKERRQKKRSETERGPSKKLKGRLRKEKRGKPHGGSGDEIGYESREETLILDTV